MDRHLTIHCHFYQPPRENPWLEAIELQDSAYPYHDWNERITAECYSPNASSRILDHEGRIEQIVNNYSKISFNFGPTLLSWMEARAEDTYRAILEADRESLTRFGGHGSALAQCYNHLIMPLANSRDRRTQVVWGIADFLRRFRRRPEGMWLPETAVDLESLEIMAELGVAFTVLAPHQARRVRPIGGRNWRDVTGAKIDPRLPYKLRLSSGRSIALFFYDGPVSRSVAFEGLLSSGERFADRLMTVFGDGAADSSDDGARLAHIATDGETYGHHHLHGDMALSYALHHIEQNGLARLTNYGEFLENFPPTHEVEIYENTSWSCAHGVERWKSDCGCNSGGHPGWNQSWRAPLREALDWLRDDLGPKFEAAAGELLRDPWAARDEFIEVVLDRSPDNVEAFLARQQSRTLTDEEKVRALKLLELQRHAMLMYTSCGWFFDELSGIETVQVIQYAGRALQLAGQLFHEDFEAPFLERLERAKSNVPEHRDGRNIFEKFVRPATVDLIKVGAHYAVSLLFDTNGAPHRNFCYDVTQGDFRLLTAGRARLVLGRARVRSEVTWEAAEVSFGVLHMGDHNLAGGVREFRGEEAYEKLVQQISETFQRGDLPESIRTVADHFGPGTYTLKLLFRDEQRRILRRILESALEEADATYRQLYQHHAPMMSFVTTMGLPLPKRLQVAAEIILNSDLRRLLEADDVDRDRANALLDEAWRAGVPLDGPTLEFAARRTIERLARQFRDDPADLQRLQRFESAVALARSLPFQVNLWLAQNDFYEVLKTVYPEMQANADPSVTARWVERFRALGENLMVRVPQPS
jgi:alpha-amylase/alpha-mannosidase (GH57 family)